MVVQEKNEEGRRCRSYQQVAGQFSSMISDLEDGSDDCQIDCRNIGEQIGILTTRHSFLAKASDRAVKIAARLKELIGE